MKVVASKLTKKYQATIPASVREIIGVGAGDVIIFEIQNDNVIVKKGKPVDMVFAAALEGTLDEWFSEEDDNAYNNL